MSISIPKQIQPDLIGMHYKIFQSMQDAIKKEVILFTALLLLDR